MPRPEDELKQQCLKPTEAEVRAKLATSGYAVTGIYPEIEDIQKQIALNQRLEEERLILNIATRVHTALLSDREHFYLERRTAKLAYRHAEALLAIHKERVAALRTRQEPSGSEQSVVGAMSLGE